MIQAASAQSFVSNTTRSGHSNQYMVRPENRYNHGIRCININQGGNINHGGRKENSDSSGTSFKLLTTSGSRSSYSSHSSESGTSASSPSSSYLSIYIFFA